MTNRSGWDTEVLWQSGTTDPELKFMEGVSYISNKVHSMAKDKGFWEDSNLGTKLALIHSEVSECLETLRDGKQMSEKIPNYTCLEEELADVVIRVLDFAKYLDLRLPEAVIAKIAHNATRPRKHGRKF